MRGRYSAVSIISAPTALRLPKKFSGFPELGGARCANGTCRGSRRYRRMDSKCSKNSFKRDGIGIYFTRILAFAEVRRAILAIFRLPLSFQRPSGAPSGIGMPIVVIPGFRRF